MAIGYAVVRGTSVYVYSEKGNQIFSKSFSPGPKAGLMGFTGSTVTICSGFTIRVYNEKGNQISTSSA